MGIGIGRLGLLVSALLVGCGGGEVDGDEVGRGVEREGERGVVAPAAEERGGDEDVLGEGFLVWESNRSGAWRLWVRDLAGGAPRQLTGDESGRRHCCPHVSPDGAWIAYLSVPDGEPGYPEGGSAGPLRIVRPAGGGERTLADSARTYFEHRAVVWRSPGELIHIDGERRTVLLDLASGASRVLVPDPPEDFGWLIDPTLRFAARGRADFGRYDADRRRVVPWQDNRGCQPYFSHDGAWAYWMAGVGGPISRLDLASGESAPILHKNDPRLPDGLGYLYFPMLSPDGLLLAFSASPGQHDHFRSDYDVFVAEVDPATLEPIGEPVRMTHDPGTDRFPDVYLEPLALGRRFGEAPLTVAWRATPPGEDWRWDLGDGAGGSGTEAEHTYDRPGRFRVTARRGDELRRGLVVVRPARPPRPGRVSLREEGSRIEVWFDEPVAGTPRASLASGAEITGWSLTPDGRGLELELAAPLAGGDRLSLAGLTDRAQRPNPMEPAELEVEPPLWPSRRDGLVFLWQTGDAPNLVHDPELGAERACTLEPSGRARLDRDFAMVLDRGHFAATDRDARRVLDACRASNRFGLEVRLTPGRPGRVAGLAAGQVDFVLRLEPAGRLRLTLRLGGRGRGAYQGVTVELPRSGGRLRAAHVVFGFEPGRMTAFVDGEPAGEWPIQGDLFQWKSQPLLFGGPEDADGEGSAPPTRLEGVAIYDRPLDAAEARENFLRYRAIVASRPAVPRAVVEARLVAKSAAPTLQQISPYEEALVVYQWRVVRVVQGNLDSEVEGDGATVRVAHWALLDGERQPALGLQIGAERRLTLEPLARQPQLEAVFVADDLDTGPAVHYEVD